MEIAEKVPAGKAGESLHCLSSRVMIQQIAWFHDSLSVSRYILWRSHVHSNPTSRNQPRNSRSKTCTFLPRYGASRWQHYEMVPPWSFAPELPHSCSEHCGNPNNSRDEWRDLLTLPDDRVLRKLFDSTMLLQLTSLEATFLYHNWFGMYDYTWHRVVDHTVIEDDATPSSVYP